jgi:hypothetical protein
VASTDEPAARRSAAPWLLIGAITVLAAVIRLIVAQRGLFADELSTYWIITAQRAGAGLPALHGLGGVVSLVGHVYPGGNTAEITPPLFFMVSWLTTQLGHTPELVRAPSLIAGVATVPLVYLLGLRTLGRAAAIAASALTALCPFLIYYSSEARAYSLMTFLVVLSTLAMLLAVDTGRARWWWLYAVASAGSVYSHYTCVFVLGAQLLWLMWSHPEARRPALLANLGAFVLFLPWLPGAINDLRSPTANILSVLSPFSASYVRVALGHWILGYPYPAVALRELPGTPALSMLALAPLIALAGLLIQVSRRRSRSRPAGLDRRLVLVFVLALSVPVGEGIVSAAGTHIFGGRNLAASTPCVLLLFAALLVAAGPRLRYVTTALAVAAFSIGAAKMLEGQYQRPDTRAGAAYVERHAKPGDVVIDETAEFSPGPLSPLDTVLRRPLPVIRAEARQERDRPFSLSTPVTPMSAAVLEAVAAAHGGRIFLVRNALNISPSAPTWPGSALRPTQETSGLPPRGQRISLPAPYRLVAGRTYSGFPGIQVQVYARGPSVR